VACRNARVENSELFELRVLHPGIYAFVKSCESSSEILPHVASDVVFEKGGGEAVTMNGEVGSGVVNKDHVSGFI